VTLLKDDELADEDAPGTVNVAYLAGLCARDWGLYYDVTRNLRDRTDSFAVYGSGLRTKITCGPRSRA
jgi:hypothetical protein